MELDQTLTSRETINSRMQTIFDYFKTSYFTTLTWTIVPFTPVVTLFGYILIRHEKGKRAAAFEARFIPMHMLGLWAAAIVIGVVVYGGLLWFFT